MDNNSAPAPLDVELYLQYYDLKRDPAEKDLLPVPLFSLVTLCALKQAGLTKETTSSKHFTKLNGFDTLYLLLWKTNISIEGDYCIYHSIILNLIQI